MAVRVTFAEGANAGKIWLSKAQLHPQISWVHCLADTAVTCQEDEDVPWQVVLVQADGCLHCSRDIVAHRLLCIMHLQGRSVRLVGDDLRGEGPTDATQFACTA